MSSAQHYSKIERVRVKEKVVEPFVPAYQVGPFSASLSSHAAETDDRPFHNRSLSRNFELSSRATRRLRKLDLRVLLWFSLQLLHLAPCPRSHDFVPLRISLFDLPCCSFAGARSAVAFERASLLRGSLYPAVLVRTEFAETPDTSLNMPLAAVARPLCPKSTCVSSHVSADRSTL